MVVHELYHQYLRETFPIPTKIHFRNKRLPSTGEATLVNAADYYYRTYNKSMLISIQIFSTNFSTNIYAIMPSTVAIFYSYSQVCS